MGREFVTAGHRKAAHALHIDCKTTLGPWITFSSGETLEKAIRYLGATDEHVAEYLANLSRWGQGSTSIRLLPNRKNLLRIDYSKL
jgi:hypothetical protein